MFQVQGLKYEFKKMYLVTFHHGTGVKGLIVCDEDVMDDDFYV